MSTKTAPTHRHPEQESPGTEVVLPGLDGTNPLGFLAALGLFRTLEPGPSPSHCLMSWTQVGGTWVPVLTTISGPALTPEGLLNLLANRLVKSIDAHPADLLRLLDERANNSHARRALLQDIATGDTASDTDWAAAVASNFAPPESINQLQTTRRDYFFGNLTSVIRLTEFSHLQRSRFQPWDYADALDNQSLHLDPSEDRRHALQWNKPAGDPDRRTRGGMLGANRLALEAIPLFASFPEAGTLRTTGFSGTHSTNTRWTWPIWTRPLTLPTLKSVLALPALQAQHLTSADRANLHAQGIITAYRTSRILVGKTPNFTPAVCVC